ncbi:MAG: ATP-binding protein [bacterium]|nr:ATP-binding protein [bacterium]
MSCFNTGMITPVNFQNVHIFHNALPQKVSFSGKKDIVVLSSNNARDNENSKIIYSKLRDGEFVEALGILRRVSTDFNPNWVDYKNGLPLLSAIYNQNTMMSKFRARRQQVALPEIITRIVMNPTFLPDKAYRDTSSPFEQGKKWTYVEMALKNKDLYLLQMLSAAGATLDDYSDEEMAQLEEYADNEFARHILYMGFADQPSFVAQNKQMQKKMQKLEKLAADAKSALARVEHGLANSESAEVAEDLNKAKSIGKSKASQIKIKGLEEYRVNLGDNIPDSLDELGGMVEAKKAINNFIIRPWNANTRQLLKKNNIDMPNGFLMYGPPGCGKTYVAKVVAKQLGLPMYEIELGSVGNSYAYTTNNRLKKIFTELEKNYKKTGVPCILFLDEIDSVAAARKLSGSDWKRDEINTLISLLNNSAEKGIIVIGATNLVDNVDEAVLRPGRFDKKIEIPLPDKAERKEIFEKLISQKPIVANLLQNVVELADIMDGKSCSDISASINVCARNAVYDGKNSVTKDDFIAAMKEIEYEATKTKPVLGFAAK